jgi:protein ImuB
MAVVAPLEFEQDEMFGSGGSRMWKEVTGLLERMSSRLGPKAVLRPRLVPDAQPEFAWQQEDWLFLPLPASGRGPGGEVKRRRTRAPNLSPPTPLSEAERGEKTGTRPIFLNTPRAVAVVSIFPGGSPRRFHWNDSDYLVERSWGPERIETGWWRGSDVRRDYYVVETTTGQRFWLFRNLPDEAWFLHGEFA